MLCHEEPTPFHSLTLPHRTLTLTHSTLPHHTLTHCVIGLHLITPSLPCNLALYLITPSLPPPPYTPPHSHKISLHCNSSHPHSPSPPYTPHPHSPSAKVPFNWQPSSNQRGEHVVCFLARDRLSVPSGPLCLVVVVTGEVTEVCVRNALLV